MKDRLISGYEAIALIKQRQQWIQQEQAAMIPARDLSAILRWSLWSLLVIGCSLALVACDGDVTVYGTPQPINERELAAEKDQASAKPCHGVAPSFPLCQEEPK